MRKFLSKSAGATFNEESPNYTVVVRKTYIEMIFRLGNGLYTVVNLVRLDNDKCLLITNWGGYFNRLQNPAVQMPRIAKNCPKLYKVLCNEDEDKICEASINMKDNEIVEGLGIEVDMSDMTSMIYNLTLEMRNKAFILSAKAVVIFGEILDNPPFPGWKDGLNNVWN